MADKQAMIEALAAEAYDACVIGFHDEESRPMSDDEANTTRRASLLGVTWTTTQPVSRFLPQELIEAFEGVGASPSIETLISDLTKILDDVVKEEIFGVGCDNEAELDGGVGGSAEREARKQTRTRFRSCVQDCKGYIEEHWDDAAEGVGFIIALITAVIWHLIVVLIVRWIIRKWFDNPDVAREMCLAG